MMFEPKSLKKSAQPQPKAALQLPVVEYIKKNWTVEFNVFTESVRITNKTTKEDVSFVDTYLHIYHVGGFKISQNYLVTLFKSSLFPQINPVRRFFDSLVSQYKHESHIDKLCEFIKAKDRGNGINYQERFKYYFKRWLVAAVAGAYGLKHNEVAFIFIHKKTFSGKTHLTREALCNRIPELSGYWKQNPMLNDRDKFIRYMAQNFFIILDEFGHLSPRELNFYKDVISENELVIKLRSGDKFSKKVDRLVSFIGSTNEYDLFTDKTQLRKFCCVELETIDKSYTDEVDFRQVWAEAAMIVKSNLWQTMAWNEADIREFESFNSRYMKQDAQFFILQLFEPTTKAEESQFMTASEITQILIEKFSIPADMQKKITNWHVGKALTDLGFEYVSQRNSQTGLSRWGYLTKYKENTIYNINNQ